MARQRMYSENVGGNWGLPAGYMEAATAPGRNIAAGISSMGNSIGDAIKQYHKNEEERSNAKSNFEMTLAPYAQDIESTGAVLGDKMLSKIQSGKATTGDYLAASNAIKTYEGRSDKEKAKLEEQSRYMADRAIRDWSFKQSQDEAARAAADRDAFSRMMGFQGQPGKMVKQPDKQTTQQIPEALVQGADFLRPLPAPRTEGQPESLIERLDRLSPTTKRLIKELNRPPFAGQAPSVPLRGFVTLRDEGGGVVGGAEGVKLRDQAVRVVGGAEGVKLRDQAVQADAMMASAPSEAFRDSARLPQPTTTPVAPQKMVPFTTSEPQASVFVPRSAQQAVAEMMQYAKEQGIQMTPQLYQLIQQRAFAENPPETPVGQQSDTTTIGPSGQTTRTYKSGKENELKPVTGVDGKPSPYFATVNGQLVKLADPTPTEARSMTEAQGKALQYLTEMQQTTSVFTKIENQGYNPTSNLWDRLTPSVMNSREGVAYSNAMDKWIEAVLRDRSGAAIADPEYAKARKVFFPEYRDSAKNVQNKRELREAAMRAMNDRVIGRPGNVYTQFGKMEGGTETVREYNPATGNFK